MAGARGCDEAARLPRVSGLHDFLSVAFDSPLGGTVPFTPTGAAAAATRKCLMASSVSRLGTFMGMRFPSGGELGRYEAGLKMRRARMARSPHRPLALSGLVRRSDPVSDPNHPAERLLHVPRAGCTLGGALHNRSCGITEYPHVLGPHARTHRTVPNPKRDRGVRASFWRVISGGVAGLKRQNPHGQQPGFCWPGVKPASTG